MKAWRWPTLTWGNPTLPSAMHRFTSEFGMGSGGSSALLSSGKPVCTLTFQRSVTALSLRSRALQKSYPIRCDLYHQNQCKFAWKSEVITSALIFLRIYLFSTYLWSMRRHPCLTYPAQLFFHWARCSHSLCFLLFLCCCFFVSLAYSTLSRSLTHRVNSVIWSSLLGN